MPVQFFKNPLLVSKRALTVLYLILFYVLQIHSQVNRYPIRNFSRSEYGKNQTSDNWCVAQGKNDLIYVGNASGVLEYDGSNWNLIPVKTGAYVLSLAVDQNGTLFVGSQNEFGYLAPDHIGKLTYHSLSDSLSEDDKFFSNVIKTYIRGEDVIFQSEEKIFVYRKGEIQVINPESSFHTSFTVLNQFYVRERDSGLLKLDGLKLVSVDKKKMFGDLGIFAMLPYDRSRILIATQEKGLWVYDPQNSQDPFSSLKTANDSLLISSKIYGGILLHDGSFALNTITRGVIILKHDGTLSSIINKEMGLRVNDVKQVIEDKRHTLWLPLNNGLSAVDYSSPLFNYGEESGIKGNVNAVIEFKDILYVATSSGLYSRSNTDKEYSFNPVKNITGQIWNLNIVRDVLIAGGTEGLFKINGRKGEKVLQVNTYAGLYINSKDIFLTGYNDLKIIDKNWNIRKVYNGISNITRIVEDISKHKDSLRVWVITRNNEIVRITISDNQDFILKKFETPLDLANKFLLPFKLENKIVFGSSEGLLTIQEESDTLIWLPQYKGHLLTEPVSFLLDSEKEVWLTLNNQPAYIDKTNSKLITKPFIAIEAGKVNVIYKTSQGITWIGADDALLSFDRKIDRNYEEDFPVLIRQVLVSNDSLLYTGSGNSTIPSFKLPYSHNDLTVEYAAPFFQQNNKMLFSYRLVGRDSSWSDWSGETKIAFIDLPEQKYTFMVRALNQYGKVSLPASFAFTINPPWYRTSLIYFLYLICFCLIIVIATKFNSRRLLRKNANLEEIISLRTNEIVEKNHHLEKQNIEIRHQKQEITDSINYAKRIQQTILPDVSQITAALPKSFVLYQPKDIVSGDFYFFYNHVHEFSTERNLIIGAADCTGHGVPGAMVSVVCSNALNRSVKEYGLCDPGKILDKVRELVLDSFGKSHGSVKDGMDISMCVLNLDTKILNWSGANNPLWIVREDKNEIEEYKADKQPIGLSDRLAPFTTHCIELNVGDQFYVFTDGYVDQFGGEQGKKFKSANLKKLLLSLRGYNSEAQKEALLNEFIQWKGDLEQVDDLCLIGVRM